MFSEEQINSNHGVLSINQLMTVFRLCDPDSGGRIKIDYLHKLARVYAAQGSQHEEEINNILNELDPNEQGTLSFREFCTGIRTIRRRQKLQLIDFSKNQSMMSPTSTATATEFVNGGGDGGAGPNHHHQPTFMLNSSSSSSLSPDQSPPHRRSSSSEQQQQQQIKSQCSSLSDGENYEWNGEDVGSGGGVLCGGGGDADSGILANERIGTLSPSSGINRHTWLRTSLRRSPPIRHDSLPNRRWGSFRHNGKRQLGSNALASQLYRSSSFNSSGRSSTCDTADDMYSDASLDEDVHNLHHKFNVLQQQVEVLQDSAHQHDERYTRAKSDNAALQARVIMLEEQLRDTEMRYEERLQDEQKRTREQLNRLEREKQLQLENASIRLHGAETESTNLKDEVARQRIRIEKLEMERKELTDQIQDLTNEVIDAKELANNFKEKERRLNAEHEGQMQLIEELSREIERLRSEARTPALPTTSPETIRLEELHEEMTELRMKNAQLQEANDELQASLLHAGLEQGRMLTTTAAAGENSLAAELEAMTQDENAIIPRDRDSVVKMQQALKEQQDVNMQLRCYIDGILLNIVENYPQLLEVKHRSA